MEWDYEKIEAAVCTLTEALGEICDVEVLITRETYVVESPESDVEVECPCCGERAKMIHHRFVPNSQKVIIAITPKLGG